MAYPLFNVSFLNLYLFFTPKIGEEMIQFDFFVLGKRMRNG